MKKTILFIAIIACLAVSGVLAQNYTPVDQASTVQFTVINHMIFKSTVTGTLKGLSGTITFNPQNPGGSSFNVSAAVKTISTGIGMRDSHLLKDEYFDEKKFPVVTIKSQNITKNPAGDSYNLTGACSIKGITKSISFPFTAELKNGAYLFKGHFSINRMDYNLGPENSIEKTVQIDLSITAKP